MLAILQLVLIINLTMAISTVTHFMQSHCQTFSGVTDHTSILDLNNKWTDRPINNEQLV